MATPTADPVSRERQQQQFFARKTGSICESGASAAKTNPDCYCAETESAASRRSRARRALFAAAILASREAVKARSASARRTDGVASQPCSAVEEDAGAATASRISSEAGATRRAITPMLNATVTTPATTQTRVFINRGYPARARAKRVFGPRITGPFVDA